MITIFEVEEVIKPGMVYNADTPLGAKSKMLAEVTYLMNTNAVLSAGELAEKYSYYGWNVRKKLLDLYFKKQQQS